MRLLRRLTTFLRRRQATDELDEELRFHLDHLESKYRDDGMTAAAAASMARRQFGDVAALRERAYDIWFGRWVVDALHDLRYASRTLLRQPAFAGIAIGTIAVAIAANTAIFSVVHAVIFQPLPYREPSRLVVIWDRDSRQEGSKLLAQYRDFEHWRAQSRSVEQLAGATWAVPTPIATGVGAARSVLAVPTTTELFTLLGVRPLVGRVFDRRDLTGGCAVVLAYRFWHDVAGAPSNLSELHLALDNRACAVVGVMAREFVFFPEPTDMWVLIMPTDPIARLTDAVGGLAVFGRLAPHVTVAAAQDELRVLSHQIDRGVRYGAAMEPTIYPLQQEFTFLAGPNLRLSLLLLSGAVAAVLLIACVNLANLLLGRAVGRQRELAIRAALGSGRGRLVRQLLAESLMLSSLGTGIGIALAAAAVRGFRSLEPVQLPVGASVEINGTVLAFAAGLAVVTTLLFGMWPAWKLSRFDARSVLSSVSATSSIRRHPHVIRILVVGEIALSFVLLSGGALLVQSAVRFSKASLGFRPEGLVFETVRLPAMDYRTPARRSGFFDRAMQALAGDADVEESAFSTGLPLRGAQGSAAIVVDGQPMPLPGAVTPDVKGQLVTPAYFHVVGVALERGRQFESSDGPDNAPVAIINAAAARKYFPGGDPIGRRVRVYGDAGATNPWLTVVGVVANQKQHRPEEEMAWVDAPTLYRPLAQNPPRVANAIVRLRDGAHGAAIQRELGSVDPGVVVGEIETARHLLDRYLAYPQFRATLISLLALVALLLAVIGVYGVLSQLAGQRVQEIGIRLALGATGRDVLMLIAREGLSITAFGLAGGLVATLWLSTAMDRLFFGLTPRDPATLGLVAVALGATSLIAASIPAVRATKTDAIITIRQE